MICRTVVSSPIEPQMSKRKINKLHKRDQIIRDIKESDVIDLNYIKETIEKVKKEILEDRIQNPPLKPFIKTKEKENQEMKEGYLVPKTLADKTQEQYRDYLKVSPIEDELEFKTQLKSLKSKTNTEFRKDRTKIIIQVLSHLKTNADYRRSDYFLANPRNPFESLDGINYDLESDDSENDIPVVDLDEENNASNNATPAKGYFNGMSGQYKIRFNDLKLADGPEIFTQKEHMQTKTMEYSKIRILRTVEHIAFPNNYSLPRISSEVIEHLEPICKLIHGSYATKGNIISSI